MIMAMFDKYITRKSTHLILENFKCYLKKATGVSKAFERVFTVLTSLFPSYRVS